MGIHFSDQARIADDRTALTELILKEYLTFPVLLSEKEFPKVYIVMSKKCRCRLLLCISFPHVMCIYLDFNWRCAVFYLYQTSGEVRYIVFKDFKNPLIYEEKDLDIASVVKGMPTLLSYIHYK